jgi:hypothetical protein
MGIRRSWKEIRKKGEIQKEITYRNREEKEIRTKRRKIREPEEGCGGRGESERRGKVATQFRLIFTLAEI